MKIMTKEKKKIAVVEKTELLEYHRQSSSVENMIMTAIKEKVSAETMERFLAMRKELKAEFAKEQFDLAMAMAQANFPEIKKTKKAMDGEKVLYAYAPIDEIVKSVKDILSEHGLSYFIKTEVAGDKVKSICIVKHIAGHSESSDMEVPLGTKTAIMSLSQQTAAAATFSKRYAFMNAFGIMTGDEDKEEALKPATGDQITEALEKLNQCKTLEALKETWSKFPKEIKGNREAIIRANEVKAYIQNENAQHPTAK